MRTQPPLEHDELVRRISRDLADGYDEELEMEIEDHHPLPGVSSSAETGAEKDYRREYFRQLFSAPGPTRQAAGLGGRFWAKGLEHHEHYSRQAVPAEMLVPEVY